MTVTRQRIAAGFGFAAVALGAFGAHALEATFARNGKGEIWETAVLYHLVHAVVLLGLSGREATGDWTFRLFAFGVVVFSGTLYLIGLGAPGWLGAITPIGGLALLGGWFSLMAEPRSKADGSDGDVPAR